MCAWSLVTDASAGCPRVVSSTDRTSIDGRHSGGCRTNCVGRGRRRKDPPLGLRARRRRQQVVVDESRQRPTEITGAIATVAALGDRVVWAIDIIGAPSAMLLVLLIQAGQSVRYASGRVVAAMSAAYSGEGKTDAKDAYVIAETPGSDGT